MTKEIVFAELAQIGMALASPKRLELIDLPPREVACRRSVGSLASATKSRCQIPVTLPLLELVAVGD
jgi:hypothetical protein